MNEISLNAKLKELSLLTVQQNKISEKVATKRDEINTVLKELKLKSHKSKYATISMAVRKSIKYVDAAKLVEELKQLDLQDYLAYIPAETKLSEHFEEGVKAGEITHDEVELVEKEILIIRLNK